MSTLLISYFQVLNIDRIAALLCKDCKVCISIDTTSGMYSLVRSQVNSLTCFLADTIVINHRRCSKVHTGPSNLSPQVKDALADLAPFLMGAHLQNIPSYRPAARFSSVFPELSDPLPGVICSACPSAAKGAKSLNKSNTCDHPSNELCHVQRLFEKSTAKRYFAVSIHTTNSNVAPLADSMLMVSGDALQEQILARKEEVGKQVFAITDVVQVGTSKTGRTPWQRLSST